MPKLAVVVKSDFQVESLDIAEQELSKLQSAVDGLIQPVDINENLIMWVNEEGLLRGDLIPNFFGSIFTSAMGSRHPIMGDIVFTGGCDENGNTLPLSESIYAELIGLLNEVKAELRV